MLHAMYMVHGTYLGGGVKVSIRTATRTQTHTEGERVRRVNGWLNYKVSRESVKSPKYSAKHRIRQTCLSFLRTSYTYLTLLDWSWILKQQILSSKLDVEKKNTGCLSRPIRYVYSLYTLNVCSGLKKKGESSWLPKQSSIRIGVPLLQLCGRKILTAYHSVIVMYLTGLYGKTIIEVCCIQGRTMGFATI